MFLLIGVCSKGVINMFYKVLLCFSSPCIWMGELFYFRKKLDIYWFSTPVFFLSFLFMFFSFIFSYISFFWIGAFCFFWGFLISSYMPIVILNKRDADIAVFYYKLLRTKKHKKLFLSKIYESNFTKGLLEDFYKMKLNVDDKGSLYIWNKKPRTDALKRRADRLIIFEKTLNKHGLSIIDGDLINMDDKEKLRRIRLRKEEILKEENKILKKLCGQGDIESIKEVNEIKRNRLNKLQIKNS